MSVELSVKDVRAALLRVKGPEHLGAGEAATLLLGRVFHEVYADLVSADPHRSGLRLIAESSGELEQKVEQLCEHSWRNLIAPRLRRHAPALSSSSREVLVAWRALAALCRWLVGVTAELLGQSAAAQRSWERLADLLRSEVPLSCELSEPGWSEPVRLIGIADSILKAPLRSGFCAIELKLGRGTPAVDLGQAALYHLILSRSTPSAAASALALMRFAPELEEHVVSAEQLAPAQRELLELVAELAQVKRRPAALIPLPHISIRPSPRTAPRTEGSIADARGEALAERYAELGKRLMRAYREQGVGLEIVEPATVGPRFVRFAVRLSTGVRVDALRRRTAEVQHRLELRTEPLISRDAGRLYVDLERAEPESVAFDAIRPQLPELDPLAGSAKIPIGVDAGGKLLLVDLGSAGRSHVLCAGTSGSGKSEWLRMMIGGLLATNTPETLRLVTLDPKYAAFADLEASRFLWQRDAWWVPGSRPASELFQDLVEEMERRYELTRASGSDNLREHVQKTGVIQANLACRVALTLQSPIESNMILSAPGAERLTGSGDLLYKDLGDPVRLQAPFLPAELRAQLFRA